MENLDHFTREMELRQRWFALVAADLQKSWRVHERIWDMTCHHFADLRASSDRARSHLEGSWRLLTRAEPRET